MSQNSIKRPIHTSYSLLAFARKFGPVMQIGSFTNQKSGDQFKSCIFTQPDETHTFVGFSSNLGELTPAEIASRKNDLQVVEFEPDEEGKVHYSLCKKGQNSWQTVDLGL